MIGQLSAAQFDLETVIADLTREGANSPALLETRSQLGALIALRGQMANASTSALAQMRNEVAAVVATSQTTAQQARTAAANSPDTGELASRAQEARAKVEEIMRGMKDFDPYLRFADRRDEEEYRKREEERRAYIAAEQAKGTVEGTRNAVDAAIAQMDDAGAHGATSSPEFAKRRAELTTARNSLGEKPIAIAKASPHEEDAPAATAAPNDLDAAMAALRGAGVTPASDATEVASASPVPGNARSRGATSGRV